MVVTFFLIPIYQLSAFCYGGIPGTHRKPGLLGHQVVMAVKEPKVIGAARGGLDPWYLLVAMEKNGAEGEPGV